MLWFCGQRFGFWGHREGLGGILWHEFGADFILAFAFELLPQVFLAELLFELSEAHFRGFLNSGIIIEATHLVNEVPYFSGLFSYKIAWI